MNDCIKLPKDVSDILKKAFIAPVEYVNDFVAYLGEDEVKSVFLSAYTFEKFRDHVFIVKKFFKRTEETHILSGWARRR